MNRIEQVAAPAPAQQPQQPRLPQPRDPRARRGASGFAAAIAALAVPLLPGTAFGAASPSAPGAVPNKAPHIRHHLHHGQVLPGPGALTMQAWAASGWTLTIPMHEDGYVPWLAEPGLPLDHPRPVVLPDGRRGEISAYRVARGGPHADEPNTPETPETQTRRSADPADSTGLDGSARSMSRGGGSTRWPSGDSAAVRGARSRSVPGPLVPFSMPANTKQMVVPSRQSADIPEGVATLSPAAARATTAVPAVTTVTADLPTSSHCLRGGRTTAKGGRYLVARLHPAADAMDVVATPQRSACGLSVDYLSQARA